MTTILVKCVDQNLQVLNSPIVASGGLQETSMQFSFCSKWEGLAKTVVFYRDKSEVYNVVLDGEDKCLIPDEVMQEKGRIYFGVYGVSGSKRKTTFILKYDIQEGAFLEGIDPSEPTPDIYEQLLTNYGEAMALFQSKDETISEMQQGIDSLHSDLVAVESQVRTLENLRHKTIGIIVDEDDCVEDNELLLEINLDNASQYAIVVNEKEVLALQKIEVWESGSYGVTYGNATSEFYVGFGFEDDGYKYIDETYYERFKRSQIKEINTSNGHKITESGLYNIEIVKPSLNNRVWHNVTLYIETGKSSTHDFSLYDTSNGTIKRCYLSYDGNNIELKLDGAFATDYVTLGKLRKIM